MSDSKKELILHLGQHKTGSKALQFFLAKNAGRLRGRGIFYPLKPNNSRGIPAYAKSHFRVFALLRRQAMIESGDGKAAEEFWHRYGIYCEPFETLDDIFDSFDSQMTRFKANRLLISAEDLFDLHTTSEADFTLRRLETAVHIMVDLIRKRNYDPRLIVYLRRQDHLLVSHYAQFIKGDGHHDLDFKTFSRLFAPRLKSLHPLEFWAKAFGPKKIRVLPYEKAALPEGIVPDFFEKVLGFAPPPEWPKPEEEPEAANVSPPRDFVEFIRLQNERANRHQSAFPRRLVLETARRESAGPGGTGDWFSDRERAELLQRHSKDNLKIARRFLGPKVKDLFQEKALKGVAKGYSGLSPERVLEISLQVTRLRREEKSRRRKKRLILTAVFLAALLMLAVGFKWSGVF